MGNFSGLGFMDIHTLEDFDIKRFIATIRFLCIYCLYNSIIDKSLSMLFSQLLLLL